MILLFLDLQGALFHSPLELKITVNFIQSIWAYVSPLVVLRPGSVQVEKFFRTSGESNQRPWRWIKSVRNQYVKCNERRTRPCHRAYYIGGTTPFHSCIIVRSPKLVSSEDRTGARAPSASYCSTEGVAPLHTVPPVPVHCATSAGTLCHQCRFTAPPVPVHCATSAGTLRHQCRYTAPPVPAHCATSAGAGKQFKKKVRRRREDGEKGKKRVRRMGERCKR